MSIGIGDGNPVRWSASDIAAACSPYQPPDAVYEQDVAPGVGIGTVKLYSSALLANTLPASDFGDYHTRPMKPGVFEVGYQFYYSDSAGFDRGHYSSCVVAAGIAIEM